MMCPLYLAFARKSSPRLFFPACQLIAYVQQQVNGIPVHRAIQNNGNLIALFHVVGRADACAIDERAA